MNCISSTYWRQRNSALTLKENTPSWVVEGGRSLAGIRRRIPTTDASKWSLDLHQQTSLFSWMMGVDSTRLLNWMLVCEKYSIVIVFSLHDAVYTVEKQPCPWTFQEKFTTFWPYISWQLRHDPIVHFDQKYQYMWPLLLTWFNFNPSMDK